MCALPSLHFCVQCKRALRTKAEMFRLGQREVFAGLASWDPYLAAGIGKEPAAPRRARCCFIYLRAQVTFEEERRSETCLQGPPASPLISSVTCLPQKGRGGELSGGRFSISFNWSVNIHPLDSAVWLRRTAPGCCYLFIYLSPAQPCFRHLNAKSDRQLLKCRDADKLHKVPFAYSVCIRLFTLLGFLALRWSWCIF